MNPSRLLLVAGLAALGLFGGVHLAAGAEADGPSIEEMLSAVEGAKDAPGAEKVQPSTPEKVQPSPPERPARRALKFSADVAGEMKKVEARASQRLGHLRKEQRVWDTVQLFARLEKFKDAAQTLWPVLRSRNPGRYPTGYVRSRMDKLGEYELEYACLMACLGEKQKAAWMLERHKEMFDANYQQAIRAEWISRYWIENVRKPRIAFVDGYAEQKAKVDALEAALAEKPDAAKQWELVKLCDPENNLARLPIRYFAAVVDMIARHPDDPRVKSGGAFWELDEAYRCHELYEESIKLIESMPEQFPENENVKSGFWLYLLGRRYADLGGMHEDMRDKRLALEAYRKALDAFDRMKKEFPTHPYCKLQSDGDPSSVDIYIGVVNRSIHRMGGR